MIKISQVFLQFLLFVVFYTFAFFVSAERPFAPLTDISQPIDDGAPFFLRRTWFVWLIYIGLAVFIQIRMMKSSKKHD